MNEAGLLILVLVVVAGVRLWPSWRQPVIGSDEGFHLLLRREIRRNRFRPPQNLEPCLLDQRLTYPWLYHQLIALLPEGLLRRVPALPSAVIDGMHSALAFYAGRWLATVLAHPECGPWAGFWSAVLFGINPALLAHGMGPRAYHTTPRPLGEFLFSMALFASLLAVHQASWGWAVLAALAGGAMLMSSKFAAQVMLFFVPLLAMIPGFSAVLLVVPASIAAALVLSGGRYADVIRGQVAHLRYYRRKLQYTFSIVSGRNQWRDFGRIPAAIRGHGLFSRETLQAAGYVYTTNTYLLALSRSGVYGVLLVLCAAGEYQTAMRLDAAPALWLLAWAFIWIVPFALTSLKHFRFLGEAERYAEYGIWPAAVLAGVGLAIAPLPWWAIVVLGLHGVGTVFVVAHAWAVHARTHGRNGPEEAGLFAFLQNLPEHSVLLDIPAENILRPMISRLSHRYVSSTDGIAFPVILEELFEGYPWPKPDWKLWERKGVQYIVAIDPVQLAAQRPGLKYDFTALAQVFANPAYRVYACATANQPETGTH